MNTIVPDTTLPPIDSDYPNYKTELHQKNKSEMKSAMIQSTKYCPEEKKIEEHQQNDMSSMGFSMKPEKQVKYENTQLKLGQTLE